MIKVILLVLLSEIFFTVGNVFFKKTANYLEARSFKKNNQAYLIFILNALKMPPAWIGIGSIAVALVIWLMALAQRDLSIVFALGSMQYILILFAARLFLSEKMDRARVTGTILIAAGICLVALSGG